MVMVMVAVIMAMHDFGKTWAPRALDILGSVKPFFIFLLSFTHFWEIWDIYTSQL